MTTPENEQDPVEGVTQDRDVPEIIMVPRDQQPGAPTPNAGIVAAPIGGELGSTNEEAAAVVAGGATAHATIEGGQVTGVVVAGQEPYPTQAPPETVQVEPPPQYREIRTHVANAVNDRLKIHVVDAPGAGGASHAYVVTGMERIDYNAAMGAAGNALDYLDDPDACVVVFQNGGIAEAGVNGITQEVLLAIVADRLTSFQRGPFPSANNAIALAHVVAALEALHTRTRERMDRGVEGKQEA